MEQMGLPFSQPRSHMRIFLNKEMKKRKEEEVRGKGRGREDIPRAPPRRRERERNRAKGNFEKVKEAMR